MPARETGPSRSRWPQRRRCRQRSSSRQLRRPSRIVFDGVRFGKILVVICGEIRWPVLDDADDVPKWIVEAERPALGKPISVVLRFLWLARDDRRHELLYRCLLDAHTPPHAHRRQLAGLDVA